jgi:hypothetical protein
LRSQLGQISTALWAIQPTTDEQGIDGHDDAEERRERHKSLQPREMPGAPNYSQPANETDRENDDLGTIRDMPKALTRLRREQPLRAFELLERETHSADPRSIHPLDLRKKIGDDFCGPPRWISALVTQRGKQRTGRGGG